ncbi:MAG: NarK/NasA family nitrate transporter [Planctomycetes bacterium]|nr:NarK/NasA family nitrate transporter [Planctomycetota bacterium]
MSSLSPTPIPSATEAADTAGALRVLTLSTTAFTLLFAVWLMFAVIGIPIQQELGLTDVQFFWLGAIAILSGSIWRLAFGILTDRVGGKVMFTGLLLFTAIPTYFVSQATSFSELMVLAVLVGLAGNSFNVGISWNSAWFPKHRQGVALGTFGAGNVGASVTKMFGPLLIAVVPAAGVAGGLIPGGWRFVPVLYAVLLIAMAAAVWFLAPKFDRKPGKGRPVIEMLRPLRDVRVWRFSLYYVVVFGAYVALSLALPKYFMAVYQLDLGIAALLAALFIFPASLLRPLGGWMSDKYGARVVMYAVFALMTFAAGLLALPAGALGFTLDVWSFTALVFLIGVGMGVGKAAVFKYIPDYFPKDVAAVGGLVGLLGALGGFVLPLMFGYLKVWTGMVQTPFVVLFALVTVSFLWLHVVVLGIKRKEARNEMPADAVTA